MEQLQKILLTEDSLTSQEMLARQVGKYLRKKKNFVSPTSPHMLCQLDPTPPSALLYINTSKISKYSATLKLHV